MGELALRTMQDEQLIGLIKSSANKLQGEINELAKLKNWLGETTTPIAVGDTTSAIIISGQSVNVNPGDVAKYQDNEFIYSEPGTWQAYDDRLDVYTKDESDARYLQKSGGALTGDVTTSVTQFTSTSLVTKNYVDSAIANITDYDEEAF